VTRWEDVGPLETTTAPAGFYAGFDDEARPAQHRAAVTAVEALPQPLPQPQAIAAVVFVDGLSRTLTARLPDLAGRYERHLWTQGWQQLRRAQEAGWPPGGPQPVFADLPGARQVAHGQPGGWWDAAVHRPTQDSRLRRVDLQAGVVAVATIDRSSHRFLTCRFLNRPGLRDAVVGVKW
jgi:hypothetical protein